MMEAKGFLFYICSVIIITHFAGHRYYIFGLNHFNHVIICEVRTFFKPGIE